MQQINGQCVISSIGLLYSSVLNNKLIYLYLRHFATKNLRKNLPLKKKRKQILNEVELSEKFGSPKIRKRIL